MADVYVRIVKPFDEHRTPCPQVGTAGRLTHFEEKYVRVEFALPFTDTEGVEWLPWGHHTTMVLKFLPDEIEPCDQGIEETAV